MKRKEILRKLEKLGFRIVDGGNHYKIYRNNAYLGVVSRESEISEKRVRDIEKQIGMKLR